MTDKMNVLERFQSGEEIEIELGCGNGKKNPGAIGIDLLDYPGVDIVGDVYEVLASFPEQSVSKVYAYHFIEHVPDVERLLVELSRVVKRGGLIEFVAPHFSNPYFYSDPTHRSFFGLYTFAYYATHAPFVRQVPTYGFKSNLAIKRVDLVFKSSRNFPFRYGIKRLFGSLFNSCTYMRELYEENFCYLFPCYEVRYLLCRE